jgi:FG-GAP-like repeat
MATVRSRRHARLKVKEVADSFAVADFNGDGKLDVAVSGGYTDVLLGNGDGTFQPSSKTYFAAGPTNIVAGQFNSDTKIDLAVSTNIGSVMLLYNTGTPVTATKQSSSPTR